MPIHHDAKQPVSIGNNAWIPAFAGMTPKLDAGLDRRVERALRQGEIEIEARIDLHGKTLAEAHAALARFMAAAVKTEKRHLLIITGKGRNNAGAIKTAVPLWLEALPEAVRILALRPAAPKHGGDGALYAILRRPPAKGRFKD